MENHHFEWVNQLCLWPFSIAMFVYQRVTAIFPNQCIAGSRAAPSPPPAPGAKSPATHCPSRQALAAENKGFPGKTMANGLPGWWYTYPSEKYEFVSWDDEIPN